MIDLNNQTLTAVLLVLAAFRVYLEMIRFSFEELPLSKMLGEKRAKSFHRFGLILSLGFILFAAPQILMNI